MLRIAAALAASVLCATPVQAQEYPIAEGLPEVRLVLNGVETRIAREGSGPACPPSCLQPLQAAAGVETFGALEVIGFLQREVAVRSGLLLDLRLPEVFQAGHLPGAVNVPAVTLTPDNPALRDILLAIGAQEAQGGLVFSAAPRLVVYGDGPLQAEVPVTVQVLLAAGYPAEKIAYFRGGLQEWLQFGLTVSGPGQGG